MTLALLLPTLEVAARTPSVSRDALIPTIPDLEAMSNLTLDHDLLARIPERRAVEDIVCRHDTVLLFGSYARGDAGPGSDIDLLVLDEHSRRIGSGAKLSVTVYTPKDFREMARHGSLFVLHLKREARVLADRRMILPGLLAEWVEPDYDRVCEGIRAAAAVLDAPRAWLDPAAILRTALFILRSLLYLKCARAETPAFAIATVARILHDDRIPSLFARPAVANPDVRTKAAMALLSEYLGGPVSNEFGSLEALAVNWRRKYPMASHLAVQLLAGNREIDYARTPATWIAT